MQGGDATAAAIRADYSRWHAGMYGQVLLAMPRIRCRIAELRGTPNIQANGDAPSLAAPSLAALAELARAWQRTSTRPPDIGSLSTLDDLEQLRQSMTAARNGVSRPTPKPKPKPTPTPTPTPKPTPGMAEQRVDTTGAGRAPVTAKAHIKDFINRNSAGRSAAAPSEPERQRQGQGKRPKGPRVAQRSAGTAARRGAA